MHKPQSTPARWTPSTKPARRRSFGELYRAAMDKTTATTTSYISLNMVQEGTAWQVDEDLWDSELE